MATEGTASTVASNAVSSGEPINEDSISEKDEDIMQDQREIIEKGTIRNNLNFYQNFHKFKRKFDDFFQKITNHNAACVSTFNNFVELMYQPTDAASIGIGRMLFGLMMLIDIPEERSAGDLATRWGDPYECHFPLFHFLKPFTFSKMCLIYAIMWLGALGITLGYKFRASCSMFVISYWFVFILDKSSWNNHSYLYGLISILFLGTSANRFCSIDAWMNKENKEVVPFWNYFIIKYQFFILYFVAGLKKMSTEWLSGYAMTHLGNHWVFTPFRLFLGADMTDLLIIHWFAWIFDLTVAFWLIYKETRPIATIFAIAFHLMNSRLFTIGMFPWVCLVELPLFYNVSWPRKLWMKITFREEIIKNVEQQPSASDEGSKLEVTKSTKKKRIGLKEKSVTCLLLLHCALQLFLPYSHFITKGYNNWTNGIYGYSWDMMVHTWDTILVSVRVIDNNNNKIHFLDPYAYTDNDRWTKHADMAYQYAHCIKHNLNIDLLNNKQTQLTSNNLSIYYDVWSSLNGRFQQRVFNPSIDILKANWSPFDAVSWQLPLLTQYTNMRYYMNNITNTIDNSTDVLFIADYPKLYLENYINKELINITLTVINGKIRYKTENGLIDKILNKGDFIGIESGLFHKIYTISSQPSCYMYTYINQTVLTSNSNAVNPVKDNSKPILPIREEFFKHLQNYKQFFLHLGNSMLYEIYGVPMPVHNKK